MSNIPFAWMTNDPGGKVEVYEKYIYVKFSHSLRKEYRIHAETLYQDLCNNIFEYPYAGLVFIPLFGTEEPELKILDESTKSDKDNAVVNREEFMEALYFWFR